MVFRAEDAAQESGTARDAQFGFRKDLPDGEIQHGADLTGGITVMTEEDPMAEMRDLAVHDQERTDRILFRRQIEFRISIEPFPVAIGFMQPAEDIRLRRRPDQNPRSMESERHVRQDLRAGKKYRIPRSFAQGGNGPFRRKLTVVSQSGMSGGNDLSAGLEMPFETAADLRIQPDIVRQ